MIIRGGLLVSSESVLRADIRVKGGTIRDVDTVIIPGKAEDVIDADGCYVFPGLVNSHDHLEFNLYPRLGSPPYRNAYEWGRDIHARFADVIRPIESMPIPLRLWWGAWKNLFSGVTVVVHHGHLGFLRKRFLPVSVPFRLSIAHSIEFDDDIEYSIRKRRPGRPFIVHVAEGTDAIAGREIRLLKELGGMDHNTVAVHALANGNGDAVILRESGAAVVWCPSSNLYLFGVTAPVRAYLPHTKVALGTDSTLTGVPTLFEELRVAHDSSGLEKNMLFAMVTVVPRQMFGLPAGTGELVPGAKADMFLVRQTRNDPMDQLFSCEPEDILLLIRNGKPVFWDSSFRGIPQWPGNPVNVQMRTAIKSIPDRGFLDRYKFVHRMLKHYPYLADLGP